MKNEYDGMQKTRQALEQSVLGIDATIANRLVEARNQALNRQKIRSAELSLAGNFASLGISMGGGLMPHVRTFMALVALTLGILGTYYWNAFEQADENEEVDSALLGGDLPVAAYTDQGFDAWLDRSPQPSEL